MRFIALDLETTGLSHRFHEIIEIGLVEFNNGEIVNTYNTFVKPKKPIPQHITDITGITNEMVKDAPSIEEVRPQVISFIGNNDDDIVAHNASFDIRFFKEHIKQELNNGIDDTLKLSRNFIEGLENYKLGTVAEHFGIINENAHRACDDAKACGQIYLKLLEKMQNL